MQYDILRDVLIIVREAVGEGREVSFVIAFYTDSGSCLF